MSGPGSGTGTSAYLGPNFQFVSASVPEPSSAIMGLIGLATVGGFGLLRRLRATGGGSRESRLAVTEPESIATAAASLPPFGVRRRSSSVYKETSKSVSNGGYNRPG